MINSKKTILALLFVSSTINVGLVYEFVVSPPKLFSSHVPILTLNDPRYLNYLPAESNLMKPRVPITLEYGKSVIFSKDSKLMILKLSLNNSIAEYSYETYSANELVDTGKGELFENYKKIRSGGKVFVEDIGSKLVIKSRNFPLLEWSFQDNKKYYLYSDIELKYN